VEVDCAFRIRIASLSDYQPTVGPTTWKAVHYFASELKKRNIKIAFFSATPQGGGVALMRHALVRFARTLGVNINWYAFLGSFFFSPLISLFGYEAGLK
jgi:alpha,alpha-trehalose phosphorylase (configuration-retaining)